MKLRLLLMFIVSIFMLLGCSTSTKQQSLDSQAVTNGDEGFWQPEVGTSWHYQLGQPINTLTDSFLDDVKVYSIDVFDNKAEDIAFLKSKGIKVICYINVGAWEIWRDDASEFPESIKLGNYDNWAGERWLDIRPPNKLDNPADGYKLREIMEARFTEAANRGCDAVEPDNLDSWNPRINLNNGQPRAFEVSYENQLDYNKYLADIAHERGLSIGYKSNVEQAADLVDYYDWALNESCTQFYHPTVAGATECQFYQDTFIAQDKAVFWVEYIEDGKTKEDFCPQANETLGLSFVLAPLLLGVDATEVERCDDAETPVITPEPVSPINEPNSEPNPNNLLANADFSNGLIAWQLGSCLNNFIDVNENNQLHMESGESCVGQSVEASAGLTYDLTCSVKNSSSNYGEMALFFQDLQGSTLKVAHLAITNSSFQTNNLREVAPEGTSYVLASFYGSEADVFVDFCSLEVDSSTPVANPIATPIPTPEPIPSLPPLPNPDNLLFNGEFEFDLKSWRNPGCGQGIVETVIDAGISGDALHIIGDSDCADQTVTAMPNSRYTLICDAKELGQGYAEIGIYFENSDGTLIRSQVAEVTGDSYKRYMVSAIAPDDAISAIADMYVFESEMFVDNCVLTASN